MLLNFTDSCYLLLSATSWRNGITGGLQRRWANKPLKTFTVDAPAASRRVALSAFPIAVSFRFFNWLTNNRDVFVSHTESLGYIWA